MTARFVTGPYIGSERQAQNDRSRNTATHHGEPWLDFEDDILLAWSGLEAELVVAAELLGRTVEACRQRYHLVRNHGRVGANARTAHPAAAPTCDRCYLQHKGEC
jgi:hypothetical protein